MKRQRLIWAYQFKHPDTGQPMPDTRVQTEVIDYGYGPVQGSRAVRIPDGTPGPPKDILIVDTRDLWKHTRQGLVLADLS